MGGTIRQSELRNNNAEIMRRVAEGESFVVTVHGRAVADLVPHQERRTVSGRLVPAAVIDELLAEDEPGPDRDAWERDMAEAEDLFDGADRGPVDPWEPRSR